MATKRDMADFYFTVPEAKRIIHDSKIAHSLDKIRAASSLMEACEQHNAEVTFADMLRCLDYGGTIAEMGWRCLFVRTGRENMPIDRAVWESYLRKHYPEDHIAPPKKRRLWWKFW